jgi:hypothetical protein
MALMILTAVWRVNPVEGSVMPDFLTVNPFGEAVLYVLVVTCMPVWGPTGLLRRRTRLNRWDSGV